MAQAIVDSCLERTGKLLIWEGQFLMRVTKQVHDVQLKLKKLQSFLKDADRKRDKSEHVFRWVNEVREVALRMEDVLETYVVNIESRRELGQGRHMLKRCWDIFCECITLHKLDPEINSIQNKLTSLAIRKESLDLEESGESSTAQEDIQLWSDARLSSLVEPDFVGREEEKVKIVAHLKNEARVLQVVSVWGMGGQGKTTIAREAYNHVKSHFEASAWVCLTRKFEPLKVLQEILTSLVQDLKPGELMAMDIKKLQEKILKVLTKKKCLVVLDDIWSEKHWKDLELSFPYRIEETGTKILLTTRYEKVANLGFVYKLERLSEDDGWNLLSKKAFPTRDNHDYDPYAADRVDKDKEKIGREIVEKCEGLPLAISTLGGVLKGKRALKDWELVKLDISFSLNSEGSNDEDANVRRILARSYDDLNFRYKQLFLYLGNYGEDEEIDTKVLYQRWISEGMVSSGIRQAKGKILMDVAESYLTELAERSLVQVTNASHGEWMKFSSCRLHDLIRDLCLFKGKEEDILNLTAIRDTQGESFDFQSVVSELSALAKYVYDGSDTRVPLERQEFGQMRSLAFVGRHELPQIVTNLQEFKLLRVLGLYNFEFEQGKLPLDLCYLIHLRYLSLLRCKLNELPSFIGDLRYLETLDLRVHSQNFTIPNVLRKLTRLKHLYLPYKNVCITTTEKLNFDGLNELEMVQNLTLSKCNIDDLVELARLQVIVDVYVVTPQQLEGALKVIASKRYTSLSVQHVDLISSEPSGSAAPPSNYLTQLFECAGLSHLRIGSDVGGSFPKEINNRNFSHSLVDIVLHNCKYKNDPMPLLEKLPGLTHLSFAMDAYLGVDFVCSARGFHRLTHLQIGFLVNLKTWSLEEGGMPKLLSLRIFACDKLEMLPDAMKFLGCLAKITIGGMSDAFNDRLKGKNGEEGEDFRKVRHVPSISVDDEQVRR